LFALGVRPGSRWVLSRDEVSSLLIHLRGPVWLMASLLYGAGLRLLECVELRVKDINFDREELTVRDGKAGKDRVTMLPGTVRVPLRDHLTRVVPRERRRHHLHESVLQRAVKDAARAAGISRPATPHALRHYAGRGIGGTRLRPTCSRMGTTFARCRNCSVIGTSVRR
jgi:integrase